MQEQGHIRVHLKSYIRKLLEIYGMTECNPVTTPIDVNVKMGNHEASHKTNEYEYQELLGRLMYVSVYARPDISYAVTCLSQFNNTPKQMHIVALKRVLRYLKGTLDYCLQYKGESSERIIGCDSDASWDSTKDAKSFTGLLVYRNGDLVHWRSKKQSITALSSTESELEAIVDGTKEVVWTYNLLSEIGKGQGVRKVMRCDNLNVVKLANGGNFKAKSKLLNRRCYYLRECVKGEKLEVVHVPNDRMIADSLTKPLSGPALLKNIKHFLKVTSQ